MLERLCAVAAMLALLGGCAARGRAFLDATIPTDTPVGGSVEGGLFARPAAPTPFPLRLDLVRTARQQYRHMETVVYDVRITNVSATDVILPWSPSAIPGDNRPAGYRQAAFYLAVVRQGQPDFVVDSFWLAGSTLASDTLLRLRPGQSALVRLPAMLSGSGAQDATNPVVHPQPGARVRASMTMQVAGNPVFALHEESSRNTLPIQIVATIPAVPAAGPPIQAPRIVAVSPRGASAGIIVQISGYRLGLEREVKPVIHFLKDGIDLTSTTVSAHYSPGDLENGSQIVGVIVPAAVTAGDWALVIEAHGRRSEPFDMTISEWAGPRAERLSIDPVNPGHIVDIHGSQFRHDDDIVFTDAAGQTMPILGGSSGESLAFLVPLKTVEGPASVQVRARRPTGQIVSSASLRLMVTNAPIAVRLWADDLIAVAAGQWTELALSGRSSLHWSERTEVEFTQETSSIITETTMPTGNRLRVPPRLAPGPATVRARVWHGSQASAWSPPASYTISPATVPPRVDFVTVGPSRQEVTLGAAPVTVQALAGDQLTIYGHFPDAGTNPVRATLKQPSRSLDLAAVRDSMDAVTMRLKGPPGEWRLVIHVEGAPDYELPMTIRLGPALR